MSACAAAGIDPLIAMGRQPHHPPLDERFKAAPPAPENPTPVEAMAHRLKTPEGKTLYALRKHTPEPVFGVIKSALGFRQFSLRGLEKVRGEWSLVTMAWNLKRMFVLAAPEGAPPNLLDAPIAHPWAVSFSTPHPIQRIDQRANQPLQREKKKLKPDRLLGAMHRG